MRKLTSYLLCCILLMGLMLPMTVRATETEEAWNSEFSRVMDITDSLSKAEIKSLDEISLEIMQEYHLDVAVAVIPEARLEGSSVEEFADGLYRSCDFGYGDGTDGFMCLYFEDTQVLVIVPMGGAAGVFPESYLTFMQERVPTLRENHGVYGVVYGCEGLIRSGLEELAQKAAEETAPETEPATEPETEPATEPDTGNGNFARCGEGSGKPVWFPADLKKAYVYFDPDAPRVVDYADLIPDKTEAALEARIAEVTAETGKDIVIVTDVSNYGLGDDIYAADFYDYNGYGIGQEHEGIVLFLNMDPKDRGGWTAETGPETRALATQSAANRLDDFLYETLAAGDYSRALTEWVEDVYGLFTTGIARPAFWYRADGQIPENYFDPNAPLVVDEWGLLSASQIAALEKQARQIRDTYGVNVYFHTTADRMGFTQKKYNELYMASMGYEKDAVLFAVENTGGNTEEYTYTYLFGNAKERVPEKFRSRVENNASIAGDGYGRLLESQRLLAAYLKNGRVPRNGFYWSMIGILAVFTGFIISLLSLRIAENKMNTVYKKASAFSYLNRSLTVVQRISETLLYTSTTRTYIPPKNTGGGSSSSGGRSTYRSSYSGHSGTSHTGHGRKF